MNAASSPSSSKDDIARLEQAKKRFEAAIAHLTALLHRCPAAEELASSWHGLPIDSDSQSTKKVVGLRELKRVLDSGKRVTRSSSSTKGKAGPPRGLPMWLVIRAVKASWHQDGSWPLLGADEDVTEAGAEDGDVEALAKLPRSIHPTALLLRPAGQSRARIPPRDPELDRGLSPPRPDPEPDEIARRYEAQGIDVGPAPSKPQGWDDDF